jgi:general nucleoside transport system permease protein
MSARLPLGPGALGATFRLVAAVFSSLLITALVFVLLGANPFDAYHAIIKGALGDSYGFGQTLTITATLTLTGVAAAIPFSAKLFNIGGEGQLYAGAVGATVLSLTLDPGSPALVVAVALIGAAVAGALWAVVPALLRAYTGANEIITTLMSTFLALLLAQWVVSEYAEGTANSTRLLPEGVELPVLSSGSTINYGVFIALAVILVAAVFLAKTRTGMAIRAVGAGQDAAKQAGFSFAKVAVVTFLIGGAAAGIAGGILVVGVNHSLTTDISGNYGYIGIAVALLARLRPLLLAPAAFLFAIITVGAGNLTAQFNIQPSVGLVVEGIFVALLLLFGVVRPRYPEHL